MSQCRGSERQVNQSDVCFTVHVQKCLILLYVFLVVVRSNEFLQFLFYILIVVVQSIEFYNFCFMYS